jgi:hypothetical protein
MTVPNELPKELPGDLPGGETLEQQTERHKRNTFIALSGIATLAALWEIWTIVNRYIGDTFSAILRMLGEGQPFIPFMFGMLNGHLWGNCRNRFPLVAVVVGFICGMFLWPLRDGQE